tara:strand:- start:496 stop:678 length:183 start_codon:yes stop_codon:yes gene_type:complete
MNTISVKYASRSIREITNGCVYTDFRISVDGDDDLTVDGSFTAEEFNALIKNLSEVQRNV